MIAPLPVVLSGCSGKGRGPGYRSTQREVGQPRRAAGSGDAALGLVACLSVDLVGSLDLVEGHPRQVADLSQRPIQEITTRDVVTVLRREEEAGNLETARRMRTVIGEVFRYAMQHGLVTSDPTQATRGAIAQPRPRNHPAIIDPQELTKLLR